jgi:hypothetical protein
MINLLGILTAAVLALLALIHVYWALGGKSGRDGAIPTVEGKRTFEPSAQ